MIPLRPMLAANKIPALTDIKYPMLASLKMDGIRCIIDKNGLTSRSGKHFPNKFLNPKHPGFPSSFQKAYEYAVEKKCVLDGEIWFPGLAFNEISSRVMSNDNYAVSHLGYHVFDCLTDEEWHETNPRKIRSFWPRFNALLADSHKVGEVVSQYIVKNADEAQNRLNQFLKNNGEGMILRSPKGKYKHGRCTFNENIMHKIKLSDCLDAKVIGFEPKYVMRLNYRMDTENRRDEFNKLKSDHKQEHRQAINALGALVVDDGLRIFCVGSGFTDAERCEIWENQDTYLGSWVRIKCAAYGEDVRPRHPVFICFRDPK